MLTLADVFEGLTGSRPDLRQQVLTEGAVDSRQVIPGGLFIALPGEHTDGHNYVGDAFHRGASLALVQQDLSDLFPQIDLRSESLPAELQIPDVPFCLRVNDTLACSAETGWFLASPKQRARDRDHRQRGQIDHQRIDR